MTLAELMERHRTLTGDSVGPPFFVPDPLLISFLNDAVAEAAIRGRLIHASAEPDACEIAVSAGDAVYPLHASLYELDHVAFRPDGQTRRCAVKQTSQEWLDANVADWRDAEGDPAYMIQGDASVRLVPRPARDGLLQLEGYRTPKTPMADPDDVPEISALHHLHLVEWSQFRHFSIQDSELYDPARAATSEAAFTAYFGPRPDADLRRISREDTPQVVSAFLP
ncbi:phage adaptor protein [Zoogloea dura]|uniref:Uncharacterized protein n=1 Tax=Zoogloea dura TaxID=2728840 RepID=A0A848FZQ6_9RHOO|nr:hypothetical protein [Zoogloea dura]NML24326.1 hypothetical protein [Zoogloea dura]